MRYYSSRELVEAIGCTRKALRVYQAKGLILPTRSSGNRRYDAAAFERLRFIVALRGVGLSVDEIGALLDTREQATNAAGPIAQRLADDLGGLIPKITESMHNMMLVRNELIETRETLVACSDCVNPIDACGHCADEGVLDPSSALLLAGRPRA